MMMHNTGPDTRLDGTLHQGVHHRQLRIYFEDTDFSGLVYHASYLRFLERGRSDFIRHLNINHHQLMQQHMAFAVHYINIHFLKPAAIDDVLTIHTQIQEFTKARVIFDQAITREKTPIVSARVSVVMLHKSRLIRLPAHIFELLQATKSNNQASYHSQK